MVLIVSFQVQSSDQGVRATEALPCPLLVICSLIILALTKVNITTPPYGPLPEEAHVGLLAWMEVPSAKPSTCLARDFCDYRIASLPHHFFVSSGAGCKGRVG